MPGPLMAKYLVEAVLWRRWNQAVHDTLHGISQGQYDIRLTSLPAVGEFLAGLPRVEPTEMGGFTMRVPIAPLDSNDPVAQTELGIRFMGQQSQRADWYIRAQRPETAYPLWRPGRGVPDTYDATKREFLLLVRDHEHRFHARWVHDESFDSLPRELRESCLSSTVGVVDLI
jgi:hypothetical protein